MWMHALIALVSVVQGVAREPDTDRDGLSDFHELHKHLTDPKKADSDGDGVPDGDWRERREYAYSVHAVMHVMAPFNVAAMNDDYQDVRLLDQRADLLEFEVVVYPFNTVASALAPSASWRKQPAEMKEFLAPDVCGNWDKPMQAQLLDELKTNGIELATLDDVEAVKRVSKWLMDRSAYEDSFTTFAVEFERGKPRVSARQQQNMDETLKRFGRTLQQQFDRELFGKGMFENKIHGSCTSSAIYLSTGLRAAGIPTRTVICVPIVDANDEREVAWIDSCLTHVGVRAIVAKAAHEQQGSWTSHTFNEVFVGGRWRRLNYTNLGQNVLDSQSLGLMVHVNTYGDHAQAALAGWGNREAHPQHAALFGGANPYSCVSLSDWFGPHSQVPNELTSSLRELVINRIYWYDDPAKEPKLTTQLNDLDSAGHFFAHIETDLFEPGFDAFMEFYEAVDRTFVLRARGREDIPARGIHKCWLDNTRDLKEFILRIEPADFARMEPGVEYELACPGGDVGLRWKVRDGLKLTRAKR